MRIKVESFDLFMSTWYYNTEEVFRLRNINSCNLTSFATIKKSGFILYVLMVTIIFYHLDICTG